MNQVEFAGNNFILPPHPFFTCRVYKSIKYEVHLRKYTVTAIEFIKFRRRNFFQMKKLLLANFFAK